MFVSKSSLKEYIGILYYRHGLFCASNPTSCLCFVFLVVLICCYPLKNLTSFSSSLEQYKQSINTFDGLEANAVINEFVQYERLADRPAWYNRVPIAYIQRIIVKSIINIPKSSNKSDNKLYLIDVFRTPIAQLFELNEFVKNFRTENHSSSNQKSLIRDLCVHVGELEESKSSLSNDARESGASDKFNSHYFPEFNCLYLSPANFWFNDYNLFNQDDDLINSINKEPYNNAKDKPKKDETSLKELLFGVSWQSTVTSINENLNLSKILKKTNQIENNKDSIVFTYAITIALRKYDKSFLDELNLKLKTKLNMDNYKNRLDKENDINMLNDSDLDENVIVNLQYTKQSYVYYIPYLVLYFLLFLYIYISVRKIEFVKSKWGLAFAAVSQVIASLFMSIGICSFFGLTPTLNGGEIFPYLIIFIGFENIVVLTKSVVSTPFDLDVRYRIALGLKKESWLITKIITFELIIIFFGILTMVPAIQEFCVFAYVGLLIDFFMQMIFFVTVLSIDIRRMELSDLNKNLQNTHTDVTKKELIHDDYLNVNVIKQLDSSKLVFRGDINTNIQNNNIINKNCNKQNKFLHKKDENGRSIYKRKILNYSNFFTNKSIQLFYFWARTRIVQRAIMILSLIWIILIFYKSLLVVELMRHDVDVKKETVEALLPKTNINLPKLIKDNLNQFLSITSKPTITSSSSLLTNTSPHINNKNNAIFEERNQYQNKFKTTPSSSFNANSDNLNYFNDDWQTLSYYHWLTLFANYNVSLYNRYVAILPQINLYKFIKQSDIIKYRNKNEINRRNSIISLDDSNKFSLSSNNNNFESEFYYNTLNNTINVSDAKSRISYKSALFELISIIVFGIPTIILLVYFSILFYRCLCSKNYEQWRKTWSTSNIKRQYRIVHSKRKNLRENSDNIDKMSDKDDNYDENSSCSQDSNSDNEEKIYNNDDLINKIINGQENEIEIEPFKLFNKKNDYFENTIFHKYPIELIVCGKTSFATSDINNQIKIWSLYDSANNKQIDMNSINTINSSVWSICISNDDQYLFVGQSNGRLGAFELKNHLNDNNFIYFDKSDIGITHIVQILKNNTHSSKINSLKSLLLKSLPSSNHFMTSSQITSDKNPNINNQNDHSFRSEHDYLILIARLNGILELVRFTYTKIGKFIKIVNENNITSSIMTTCINPKFSFLNSLKINDLPFTYLHYPNMGEYLLCTSQDCQLKVIKVNSKNDSIYEKQQQKLMSSNLPSIDMHNYINDVKFIEENLNEELKLLFSLVENNSSLITSICTENENISNAATGSQNGLICLWDLLTGECKLKLNHHNKKNDVDYSKNDDMHPILQLQMTSNLIISLSDEPEMCFWNRLNGELLKEFKFFAPILSIANPANHENNQYTSSLISLISSKLYKLILASNHSFTNSNTQHNNEPNIIPPSMCLYSNKILITAGCSCIFLWNVVKAELIKKINISVKRKLTPIKLNKNNTNSVYKYSQLNQIKEIKIIQQNNEYSSNLIKDNSSKRSSKLVLLTDYADSIYILKIPSHIIQNNY